MKLAIVFEVPDDRAGELLRAGVQLIEYHAKAVRRGGELPEYWQFPMYMQPVAVATAHTDEELGRAVGQAFAT